MEALNNSSNFKSKILVILSLILFLISLYQAIISDHNRSLITVISHSEYLLIYIIGLLLVMLTKPLTWIGIILLLLWIKIRNKITK
jgi:hypothetical protein